MFPLTLSRTYKKEEVNTYFLRGRPKSFFLLLRGILIPQSAHRILAGAFEGTSRCNVLRSNESLEFNCLGLLRLGRCVRLSSPGEAESGSAGVQPDEEYPGRRCSDSISWSANCRPGFFHRTPEPCLSKLTILPLSNFGLLPRFLSLLAAFRVQLRFVDDHKSRPSTYRELSLSLGGP